MAPALLHPIPHRFLLPRRPGSAGLLLRVHLKPLSSSSPPSSPLDGPSLRRGRDLPDHPDPFARAFDLAALRVPAASCAPLERRLRGHLLNWRRVRNVARLPNDQGLLGLGISLPPSPPPRHPNPTAEEPGSPAPLAAAVARREKLAREFDARGFLRFPNLSRLSRPSPAARKRRGRKGDGSDEETTREPDRDKAYVVEIVREEGTEDDEDKWWKGLVGEEGFGRGAWWMGPTRLLLLDESYAERRVDELPEAVKVLISSGASS
jgi:tRNA (guanine37-N1)-methyltransferase